MYSIILVFTSLFLVSNCSAQFSFKKMYNYIIPPKLHQEVVYEEIPCTNITLLSIDHKREGNLSITANKNQKTVALKAIKRSPEQLHLPKLRYAHKLSNQELSIQSSPDELIDGSIDLELIVPSKMAVNVKNQYGTIITRELGAPSTLISEHGDVTIIDAQSFIEAVTLSKGNICYIRPQKRVKAQTNNGGIRIEDACDSVVATTEYGNIDVLAREVPSTSSIKLCSFSGSINLRLPSDTNADVQASTKHGIITSDHFITFKPFTTQLNRHAFKQLQKQIDGTIGSGEAQIKLSSVKSNIKLIEIKS